MRMSVVTGSNPGVNITCLDFSQSEQLYYTAAATTLDPIFSAAVHSAVYVNTFLGVENL